MSPRFVPSNAADMHRVRQSLPYLRENGWEPTVLAVEPDRCDAPTDALLGRTVPGDVRVVRTTALDARLTRRIGMGSFELRAFPFLRSAGNRLLARERFDLVFFSTTAFTITALGPYWLARYGVPFAVDFQDPWLSDYYDRPGAPEPPGGHRKYRLAQRLARWLEPYTMKRVAHVISVSPAYLKVLVERYDWLREDRFTLLPFGAPTADLDLLRDHPVPQHVFDPEDGWRHWMYVGRAGADMAFSLRAFFLALARARAERPEEFDRLRLHFVGTDYAPPDRARRTVEPIAAACGVGDLVEERTGRIPYFEALQCLMDADALIVPGSDDPGYTASKIYPYILARKPLLAIFHERSTVVEVIDRTRAGVAITFSSDESVEEVSERVSRAWFRGNGPPVPDTDWSAFEPYTAREMTRKQCEVFEGVVANG